MKKTFPLEVVLSSIYGKLLCTSMQPIYECLGFLFNDTSLLTHQLPKAGRTAQPLVEAQHPFLKEIDLSRINRDTVWDEVARIKAAYPNEVELLQIGEYSGGVFSDLEEML